ncbi:MAG: hypothetical protein MJ252_07430 [archaeon]|nr:hypothetical protein [archaeon]
MKNRNKKKPYGSSKIKNAKRFQSLEQDIVKMVDDIIKEEEEENIHFSGDEYNEQETDPDHYIDVVEHQHHQNEEENEESILTKDFEKSFTPLDQDYVKSPILFKMNHSEQKKENKPKLNLEEENPMEENTQNISDNYNLNSFSLQPVMSMPLNQNIPLNSPIHSNIMMNTSPNKIPQNILSHHMRHNIIHHSISPNRNNIPLKNNLTMSNQNIINSPNMNQFSYPMNQINSPHNLHSNFIYSKSPQTLHSFNKSKPMPKIESLLKPIGPETDTNININTPNIPMSPSNIHPLNLGGNIPLQNTIYSPYAIYSNPNNNIFLPMPNLNKSIGFQSTPTSPHYSYNTFIMNNLQDRKLAQMNLDSELFNISNCLSKMDKIDYEIFWKLKGNLVTMIKTQRGSRIFQNYLKKTDVEIIHLLYLEIKPFIVDLMNDLYGNYFCNKIYGSLNKKDRIDFLFTIKNDFVNLSFNQVGTFPIQGIIEQCYSKSEKKMIINLIRPLLLSFCQDPCGTHVVEKIISCFEEEYIKFILDYLLNNFLLLANHLSGICVVKKLVGEPKHEEVLLNIKNILIQNEDKLINHPYANQAIQAAIQYWDLHDLKEIMSFFEGKFAVLSNGKYSSNVVEKYIEKDENNLHKFIYEISNDGDISEIMKNSYGNYVIQKALKLVKGEDEIFFAQCVERNIYKLTDTKLINKWKNIVQSHLPNNNI